VSINVLDALAEIAGVSAAVQLRRRSPYGRTRPIRLRHNVVRYCYRPFDLRWLYWEPETKLLDEKRAEYFPYVRDGNVWLGAAQQNRKDFDPPLTTSIYAARHVIERGANLFPLYLRLEGRVPVLADVQLDGGLGDGARANVSPMALRYLATVDQGGSAEDLFYHAVAVLYARTYREENSGALRRDWPRVPLPDNPEALLASAELGHKLAALLDPEQSVPDVTVGSIRPELRRLGNIAREGGGVLNPDAGELAITVGWGHGGKGGITMPGSGRVVQRDYTPEERGAIEEGVLALGLSPDEAFAHLGEATFDIYLNQHAYWRNVPSRVWSYTIGGYQVVKKWLSYREASLLGRPLRDDEARYVTEMVRRIAAILLLEPALDTSYATVKASTYSWCSEEGVAPGRQGVIPGV
jgi:Type ISP C-terminal specificity domain